MELFGGDLSGVRQFLPARRSRAIVDLSLHESFYGGYRMKFKKWLCSSFVAIAAVFMVAQNASAASGAYKSSAVVPVIYSKNYWYNVAYPVVGKPPSTATVTTVYYTWKYNYPRPAGFLVYLCRNDGNTCWDITRSGSGFVDFTGYRVPANQSLKLYSRVNGTNTMAPLPGGATTVTVNYGY